MPFEYNPWKADYAEWQAYEDNDADGLELRLETGLRVLFSDFDPYRDPDGDGDSSPLTYATTNEAMDEIASETQSVWNHADREWETVPTDKAVRQQATDDFSKALYIMLRDWAKRLIIVEHKALHRLVKFKEEDLLYTDPFTGDTAFEKENVVSKVDSSGGADSSSEWWIATSTSNEEPWG